MGFPFCGAGPGTWNIVTQNDANGHTGTRMIRRWRTTLFEEGMKEWVTAGEEYVKLMDEYDASVWSLESKYIS
jgi:hypothetical protein